MGKAEIIEKMKNGWNSTKEIPADGESIWVLVKEWSGGFHSDYGVVYYDTDGVQFKSYEMDGFELWPPSDVHGWLVAKVPDERGKM